MSVKVFNTLSFLEICEGKDYAKHTLECGYQVDILHIIDAGAYNCNLIDSYGNIIDSDGDLDAEGVDWFISKSIKFVEEYKDIQEGSFSDADYYAKVGK